MVTMLISRPEAKAVALAVKAEVRQQAIVLKHQGYSNYDISETLNLPYPHVVEMVLKFALLEGFTDKRKYQRQLEEVRLEHLFNRAYQSFESTGSADWYDRLLKTSERKSKLLGLDAPTEQIITGANGGPVQFQNFDMAGLTDKELSQMKALAMKAAQKEPETDDDA